MLKATVMIIAAFVMASPALAHDTNPLHQQVAKLESLAAKGVWQAELCLSGMYFEGLGVKRDDKLAQHYLSSVVTKHDTLDNRAAVVVSKIMSSRSATEWSRGRAELTNLALQGSGYAQGNIGIAYLYGAFGWSQSYSMARYWLHKSALQNFPASQLFLAAMDTHGWGGQVNAVQAKRWFDKAIQHKTTCPSEFVILSYGIALAQVKYPRDVSQGLISGNVTLGFHDLNGKALDVVIVKSSGHPELDKAALAAMTNVSLPGLSPDLYKLDIPWTVNVEFSQYRADPESRNYYSNQILGSISTGTYRGKVRRSIQNALVFPLHVLVYGSEGTDSVTATFNLQDGYAHDIRVVKSSQDKYEDTAVVAAIKSAHFPPTPKQSLGRKINFTITIQFSHVSQAPVSHTMQKASSPTLPSGAVTHFPMS